MTQYRVTAREASMCAAKGLTVIDRSYYEATVICRAPKERDTFWACRLFFLRSNTENQA